MKSRSNRGSNRDDGSSDKPETKAAHWVPDEIPAAMLEKYEHQAQVLVVATRHMRNAPRPRRIVVAAERLLQHHSPRHLLLPLSLATVISTSVWLGPANGAVAAFVVASTLAVLTISTLGHQFWRLLVSAAGQLENESG